MTKCMIEGCEKAAKARNLCVSCYSAAVYAIQVGKTTWPELVAKGLAQEARQVRSSFRKALKRSKGTSPAKIHDPQQRGDTDAMMKTPDGKPESVQGNQPKSPPLQAALQQRRALEKGPPTLHPPITDVEFGQPNKKRTERESQSVKPPLNPVCKHPTPENPGCDGGLCGYGCSYYRPEGYVDPEPPTEQAKAIHRSMITGVDPAQPGQATEPSEKLVKKVMIEHHGQIAEERRPQTVFVSTPITEPNLYREMMENATERPEPPEQGQKVRGPTCPKSCIDDCSDCDRAV